VQTTKNQEIYAHHLTVMGFWWYMIQTKETIKATPNYSKRTFTLRCYINGTLYVKYRTTEMSEEEFNSCEYNTNNDWQQYLTTDDYYKVKK
tara:strand:- start:37 stop:309 length:273 start_codon:yes stop_codon:yes gene_type:complete